jgi:RimJ/RimL family protein N-acetyltransferase
MNASPAADAVVHVSLRPATHQDLERTFAWANDPDTRTASFRSALIERTVHELWLSSSLERADRRLWIAELDGEPIAVLRLDICAGACGDGGDHAGAWAEVGLNLAPDRRGQGLSSAVLGAGLRAANELGLTRLVARIRPSNERSIRCFTRAGFRAAGQEHVAEQAALRYELELPAR